MLWSYLYYYFIYVNDLPILFMVASLALGQLSLTLGHWLPCACEITLIDMGKEPLGPTLLTGINLIPACISNLIYYEIWDEITCPFANSNGTTIEVWEWINNFMALYWTCDYLSMLGLKSIHVSKMGPWTLTTTNTMCCEPGFTCIEISFTKAERLSRWPYCHDCLWWWLLNHCGLMLPCGSIDLDQHWLR